MLTTDMRKPPIESPEQILERNLTIAVLERREDVYKLLNFFSNDSR